MVIRFLVGAGGVPLRAPKSQLQLTIVMGFYMERHGEAYEYRPLTWIGCVQLFKPDKERTLQRFGRMQRNRNFLFSEEEKKQSDIPRTYSAMFRSWAPFVVSLMSASMSPAVSPAEAHDVGRFTFIGALLLWSRACYINIKVGVDCIVPQDPDLIDMGKGTIVTGLEKQDR